MYRTLLFTVIAHLPFQASKRKLGLLNLLAAAGPTLAPPTLLLPLLLAAAVDPSDPVSR